MTIVSKNQKKEKRIEIDLNGPNGNAFVLMGIANQLGRRLGLDVKQIQTEMRSGDYENLLKVMENYFGKYIVMYR
jgi:hypothetical protein